MEQKSTFQSLIEHQHYEEAVKMLEEDIKAARLIDPRDDYTWGPASDQLGYRILAKMGASAYVAYWQGLIRFFVEDLEPTWGHLHKGHHYFRLGLGLLAVDIARAIQALELSFQDDCLMSEQRTQEGLGFNIEDTQKAHPSYITLVVVERLKSLELGDYHDRFYEGLATLHFDVIYDRKEVSRFKVHNALRRLIPLAQQQTLISMYRQLTQVELLDMTPATFELLCNFLQQVLTYRIITESPTSITERTMQAEHLGSLLSVAASAGIFPNPSIEATCRLINLLPPFFRYGDQQNYRYPAVGRVGENVAITLKILFDQALVEWGNILPEQ